MEGQEEGGDISQLQRRLDIPLVQVKCTFLFSEMLWRGFRSDSWLLQARSQNLPYCVSAWSVQPGLENLKFGVQCLVRKKIVGSPAHNIRAKGAGLANPSSGCATKFWKGNMACIWNGYQVDSKVWLVCCLSQCWPQWYMAAWRGWGLDEL